jgi:hypothetical protein
MLVAAAGTARATVCESHIVVCANAGVACHHTNCNSHEGNGEQFPHGDNKKG